MPVIDTQVLFAVADSKDKWHQIGSKLLTYVNEYQEWYIPSFALLEFDLVLKSREYSESDRMEKLVLLINDYPHLEEKTIPITPKIIHETARVESLYLLDYFDAGMVASALILDKKIATTDQKIIKIPEIEVLWK